MSNDLETQAACECFHSFFDFSQTFTSVSIKLDRNMFSISLEKENNLLSLVIKM